MTSLGKRRRECHPELFHRAIVNAVGCASLPAGEPSFVLQPGNPVFRARPSAMTLVMAGFLILL